jgi:hypothetical protein
MIFKISKGAWFLSAFGALAALLFTYAGLPEQVVIQQNGPQQTMVSREVFFYAVVLVLALINVLVFVLGGLIHGQTDFKAWFNGLIVVLNVFFIFAVLLISTANSQDKFNFQRIGFTIYGSVGLIIVWVLVWPFYWLMRKFSNKPLV